MKVLDHVPPTMHNFVANIFETLDLPSATDNGFYRCGLDQNSYCSTIGYKTWDDNGVVYEFTAHFEGSPYEPYEEHKVHAYLDLEGMYSDVRIEWIMAYDDLWGNTKDLPEYWPGVKSALRGFTAQVYFLGANNPVALRNRYEFFRDMME